MKNKLKIAIGSLIIILLFSFVGIKIYNNLTANELYEEEISLSFKRTQNDPLMKETNNELCESDIQYMFMKNLDGKRSFPQTKHYKKIKKLLKKYDIGILAEASINLNNYDEKTLNKIKSYKDIYKHNIKCTIVSNQIIRNVSKKDIQTKIEKDDKYLDVKELIDF